LRDERRGGIPRAMKLADPPLPEIWAATPAAAQALIVALQARIHELEAQLGQNSSNSSRPPSSDPPQAPPRPKAPPTGRKRGGQPGHRANFRALLPVEQADEVVVVLPERCRHCGRTLPEPPARRRSRVWRHQVVEVLPLAVQVTEYQMVAQRCPVCGKRTRAHLPPDVPRRPFRVRLTAVIALFSGRYRLSRREVRQLLEDLWAVRVSVGAVVRQEQVQSAALAPIVEEARAAVQQAQGAERLLFQLRPYLRHVTARMQHETGERLRETRCPRWCSSAARTRTRSLRTRGPLSVVGVPARPHPGRPLRGGRGLRARVLLAATRRDQPDHPRVAG
jgi:hypothetical protein